MLIIEKVKEEEEKKTETNWRINLIMWSIVAVVVVERINHIKNQRKLSDNNCNNNSSIIIITQLTS